MEADIVRKCLSRGTGMCSFMTYSDIKVFLLFLLLFFCFWLVEVVSFCYWFVYGIPIFFVQSPSHPPRSSTGNMPRYFLLLGWMKKKMNSQFWNLFMLLC